MAHAFHRLFYHFVCGTHAREPHICRSFRTDLLRILNAEVKKRGGHPIRHNAVFDHVHLLVRLPPTIAVSEFIGQLKGATAYRVNHEIKPEFKLQWQEGYGVLTLRESELPGVGRYIDNQEQHHHGGKLSTLLETIDCVDDDWGSWQPPEGGQ